MTRSRTRRPLVATLLATGLTAGLTAGAAAVAGPASYAADSTTVVARDARDDYRTYRGVERPVDGADLLAARYVVVRDGAAPRLRAELVTAGAPRLGRSASGSSSYLRVDVANGYVVHYRGVTRVKRVGLRGDLNVRCDGVRLVDDGAVPGRGYGPRAHQVRFVVPLSCLRSFAAEPVRPLASDLLLSQGYATLTRDQRIAPRAVDLSVADR